MDNKTREFERPLLRDPWVRQGYWYYRLRAWLRAALRTKNRPRGWSPAQARATP